MDRQLLLEHLAETDRHIVMGRNLIARQQAEILRRQREGRDATRAERILEEALESQAMHVANRERLLKELRDHHEPSPGSGFVAVKAQLSA